MPKSAQAQSMILYAHTTNNIWFILGNSLIQEGKAW
jgi:hypothetical protein